MAWRSWSAYRWGSRRTPRISGICERRGRRWATFSQWPWRSKSCAKYRRKSMVDDVDTTKQSLIPRPFVTLSYAQTLDGRLATSTGSSQWISAPESLRLSHELRAEHDAIMVGVGTVCVDNPRLTVRLAAGCNPLRVVVDRTLRTPLAAAVLMEGAAPGTVVAVTDSAPAAKRDKVRALGANVLCLPTDARGRVDLVTLLTALRQLGVGSVLVEGGAQMITALLQARQIDRLVV